MTIAEHLGLDVSTVQNFFMNARRRCRDRFDWSIDCPKPNQEVANVSPPPRRERRRSIDALGQQRFAATETTSTSGGLRLRRFPDDRSIVARRSPVDIRSTVSVRGSRGRVAKRVSPSYDRDSAHDVVDRRGGGRSNRGESDGRRVPSGNRFGHQRGHRCHPLGGVDVVAAGRPARRRRRQAGGGGVGRRTRRSFRRVYGGPCGRTAAVVRSPVHRDADQCGARGR